MMRQLLVASLLPAASLARPALEKPNIVMLFVDGMSSLRLVGLLGKL
jgi:hypothetical protein